MKRLLLVALAVSVVAPPVADAKPRKSKTSKKKKKKQEDAEREKAELESQVEIDPPAPPTPPPAPEPEPEPEPEADAEPVADVTVEAKPAATKQQKLYVRAGIAHVAPLAMSRELELADVTGPASLAVQNGPIEGSGASVSSATIPALIIGYRLRPRWALETVLGLPFTVTFRATGTLANESLAPMALGIPTGVPPLGSELGTAKAAPPVITAVYDILGRGKLRPYAGGGLAVLLSFDTHVTNPILLEVEEPEMHISPAPGVVLQGGVETRLTGRFYARLDVKFIALMLARAEVTHIQVRTPELPLFDTVEVGTAKMSVWVNPLIVQGGVGADF